LRGSRSCGSYASRLVYKKCGPLWGRFALVEVLAHAVDHLVELARNDGIYGDPAGQHVGGGVEEAPRGAVAPVEGGIFPLAEDVRDTLDADDVLSVEVHDGMVGTLVGEGRGFVVLEGAGRESRAGGGGQAGGAGLVPIVKAFRNDALDVSSILCKKEAPSASSTPKSGGLGSWGERPSPYRPYARMVRRSSAPSGLRAAGAGGVLDRGGGLKAKPVPPDDE
jgi:hypothetical protein